MLLSFGLASHAVKYELYVKADMLKLCYTRCKGFLSYYKLFAKCMIFLEDRAMKLNWNKLLNSHSEIGAILDILSLVLVSWSSFFKGKQV